MDVVWNNRIWIAQSVSSRYTENGMLATSFFFNREEDALSSTDSVVAFIAYQIALKSVVCDVIKNDVTFWMQPSSTNINGGN